ncbi:MAG: CBS domain-containing protein [Planctomycetes bacterium]|nr:CBS domain-containing protein [Planctomycetota bacterium]
MKVESMMKRPVATCRADQSLNDAAQVFWENDCGIVPVVDEDEKLVGVLTDRDVTVSAYFRGGSLRNLSIADAMARNVLTVAAGDDVEDALELMRTHQVRRLPVVDAEGRVEGILSLSDVCLAVAKDEGPKPRKLVRAFAAICGWREDRRAVVLDLVLEPKATPAPAPKPKANKVKVKAKSAKTKAPKSTKTKSTARSAR